MVEAIVKTFGIYPVVLGLLVLLVVLVVLVVLVAAAAAAVVVVVVAGAVLAGAGAAGVVVIVVLERAQRCHRHEPIQMNRNDTSRIINKEHQRTW